MPFKKHRLWKWYYFSNSRIIMFKDNTYYINNASALINLFLYICLEYTSTVPNKTQGYKIQFSSRL